MKTLVLPLLTLLTFLAHSQQPIGDWRDHLPYGTFTFVGETSSHYFAANRSGALSYDKTSGETQKHNKTTTLTDMNITAFLAEPSFNKAIVGYENGNLDIIALPEIINQPAILRAGIQGSKRINNIRYLNGNIYICTGFGIVKMDPNSYDILDSYIIGKGSTNRNVLDIIAYNGAFYASTDAGMYMADATDPHLANSARWTSLDSASMPFGTLFVFQDLLYGIQHAEATVDDSLFVFNGISFTPTAIFPEQALNSIAVKGDTLLIAHQYELAAYTPNFEKAGKIFTYGSNTSAVPKGVMFGSAPGTIVAADESNGLVITSFENQFNSETIALPGPKNMLSFRFALIGDALWVLAGGDEGVYAQPEAFIFESEEWSYLNLTSQADSLRNLRNVVESNGTYYFALNHNGIAEYKDGKITQVFNPANSKVQDAAPNNSYDYYGITDITMDEMGILWAANSLVTKPLVAFNPANKQWMNFAGPLDQTDRVYSIPGKNIILVPLHGSGILAHHSQGTQNFADDIDKVLNTGNAGLPSNDVFAMAADADGELWLGTSAGIAVIYTPENIFSNAFEGAQKILVKQDQYNGYLLETESVTAIAVDGANRKWIGTASSGAFLVSEDGKEQIHHFTENNSPLLSNNIYDIAIHPKTGEVFFATPNGLVSYRSDATAPKVDFSEILAFPNPVKPEYSGPIAITGLMEGTVVKITDAAGYLVYETLSQGGQAVWDGLNPNGKRAASGVYLIMCATPDGVNSAVTKLLFLN